MRGAILLVLGLVLAEPGCGGSSGEPAPATTCPISTVKAAPSFKADLLPALQASCGSRTYGCHGSPPPPTGHVEYDTDSGRTADDVYLDLVGHPPANAPPGYFRIAAGDLAHSWLIEKITKDQPGGSGYGARMPYGGANVCQATVTTIQNWIAQGAPNN
jgi:hypothetical protein